MKELKIILIITAIITILMFISITNQAEVCRQSGGEYINTNEGGVCFDKEAIK